MNPWQFPGARWWKFDFHTHTPASFDFLEGCSEEEKAALTPELWLRRFMEKGLDCVAVTDHNSGGWIDRLKGALHTLKDSDGKPEWYQPLCLFPGVEISVNGGVHLLAVFDPEKSGSDIDTLLGAVGYNGTKGTSDGVTTKSLTEVVDEIVKKGGVPIPAHVDKEKGLFEAMHGNSLEQALDNPNIYAMELRASDYPKPQLYVEKKRQWTEVKGSDIHNFRGDTFGRFTWIKMDQPSIEGLKLSLIDGAASVNRNTNDNLNRRAELVIEGVEIDQATYIGRSSQLNCRFSPFLNTIIGGRGSGKSTLLEFMRFALRRDKEIPNALQQESRKYFNVGGQNLLTENSQISLIYRKGDARYRLNWSAKADVPSLQGEENGSWAPVAGEIKSLFPARIYSQKQIFELARNPRALIDIVDEASDFDYVTVNSREKEFVNRYKQMEQKIQELNEKIAQENRLRGESNDLARQIEQIEKSRHKAVLQNYRKRQQQLTEIVNLERDWQEMSRRLLEMRDDIAPARFNEQHFIGHIDILSVLRETNEKWQAICHKLSDLVKEAQSVVEDWKHEKDKAAWMRVIRAGMAQYAELRTQA